MTPAHERKAKERQRRKDAGEVRLEFWVPADKAESVKDAVAAVCAPPGKVYIGQGGGNNPQLTPIAKNAWINIQS